MPERRKLYLLPRAPKKVPDAAATEWSSHPSCCWGTAAAGAQTPCGHPSGTSTKLVSRAGVLFPHLQVTLPHAHIVRYIPVGGMKKEIKSLVKDKEA